MTLKEKLIDIYTKKREEINQCNQENLQEEYEEQIIVKNKILKFIEHKLYKAANTGISKIKIKKELNDCNLLTIVKKDIKKMGLDWEENDHFIKIGFINDNEQYYLEAFFPWKSF